MVVRRCAIRSSSVASAQWMSSNLSASGRSEAMLSSSFRTPQKSSGTGKSPSSRPTAAATRSITAASPPRLAIFPRATSGASSSTIAAASRTISTSGQNVMPRPYGRQRPRRVVAVEPIWSKNSSTRRDLPTPAWATIVTIRQLPAATAASNSATSVASSASRPTMGSCRRGTVPTSSTASSR